MKPRTQNLFKHFHLPLCIEAPRLSKTLRESYTINPSLQPRFTACLFNGNPPLTITWTYNGQRYV